MYKILSYIDVNFDKLTEEMPLAKPELLKILIANLEQKAAKVFKENWQIVLKLHNIVNIFEKKKYFLAINCNIVAF
jgi:hypothetical protein